MKWTNAWAAVLLAFAPFAWAQQAASQPGPPLPASVLGPQLVMWSQIQKPQPTPQPLPPPERADQTQPAQRDAQPQQQSEPSGQTFTGMIVKDGNKYVLKASDGAAYQLDDQEKAKLFEGKQVKIAGTLDGKTNLLHITTIELAS